MRERAEPAPLAPEPPRWPGPGLRPRLGPAAARAGGCPGGRGSGFGAGRAGPARRGFPSAVSVRPRPAGRGTSGLRRVATRLLLNRAGGSALALARGTARRQPQQVVRRRPAASSAARGCPGRRAARVALCFLGAARRSGAAGPGRCSRCRRVPHGAGPCAADLPRRVAEPEPSCRSRDSPARGRLRGSAELSALRSPFVPPWADGFYCSGAAQRGKANAARGAALLRRRCERGGAGAHRYGSRCPGAGPEGC